MRARVLVLLTIAAGLAAGGLTPHAPAARRERESRHGLVGAVHSASSSAASYASAADTASVLVRTDLVRAVTVVRAVARPSARLVTRTVRTPTSKRSVMAKLLLGSGEHRPQPFPQPR